MKYRILIGEQYVILLQVILVSPEPAESDLNTGGNKNLDRHIHFGLSYKLALNLGLFF